jgi:hypothetical protein
MPESHTTGNFKQLLMIPAVLLEAGEDCSKTDVLAQRVQECRRAGLKPHLSNTLALYKKCVLHSKTALFAEKGAIDNQWKGHTAVMMMANSHTPAG